MGMGDFARFGGLGIRGYYEGRDWREDAEEREEDRDWMRNRRARQIRREGYLDPAEEERTEIGLKRDRRADSMEEFRDPYDRRGIVRGDENAERESRFSEFHDPYRRRDVERSDEMGEIGIHDARRESDFRDFNDRFRRNAATRADEMGGHALNDSRRNDKWGGYAEQDMDRSRTGQEYVRNAQMAIANFEASGNPAALEDFYNNMYPDDGQVTIEKLGDGRYRGTFADGQTSIVTREELLKGSKEFFMSHPAVDDAYGSGGMGMGMMPGASYRGRSGSYTRGGIGYSQRGGYTGSRSSAGSAYMQKVDDMTATFMQRDGLSPIEARARAHEEANYSSRTPPDQAAAEFYADMMEVLMPDRSEISYKSPEEREQIFAEVELQAQRLTETFLNRIQKGYNRESSGTGDGSQGSQIPQEHVDMLRAAPNDPQMRAYFDEVYGEGAAEAVLNGN